MDVRILVVGAVTGLSSCQNTPEPYAPPEQRPSFENVRPYRIARVVNMDDPDAKLRIVQGISDHLEGNWRWTQQRPTLRIHAKSNANLKYVIDFAVADATFRDTGPVTISFFVNDHPLDRVKYTSPGEKHFEKAVPSEWVAADQDVTVAAEVDKVWVSKLDGARLGFILTRMGLSQPGLTD